MTEPLRAEEPAEPPKDLGFGGALSRAENRARLLNPDGTFTTRRVGLGFAESFGLYHYLLTTRWHFFLLWVLAAFVVVNALFAGGYVALGSGALRGTSATGLPARLAEAFFFSIHTISTIGYGNVVPESLAANLLDAFESLVGLIGAAILAGLVFARVSRPRAGVRFSDQAVIAPYHGGTALMFRLANARQTELIKVRVAVNLSLFKKDGVTRQFAQLRLERTEVEFMPTTWTVVHPIDLDSPLHGLDEEGIRIRAPEVFVLLTATEEVFSETVHARRSYAGEELAWGARFVPILEYDQDGRSSRVDISRLSETERVPLPVG
ncbi:MAG: ion channel [Gemmatimonadales bacterium]